MSVVYKSGVTKTKPEEFLKWACSKNDHTLFYNLITNQNVMSEIRNLDDVIVKACEVGNYYALTLIFKKDNYLYNMNDGSHYMPLLRCFYNPIYYNKDIVKLLIENGASINKALNYIKAYQKLTEHPLFEIKWKIDNDISLLRDLTSQEARLMKLQIGVNSV